jgi:hypothetical protein
MEETTQTQAEIAQAGPIGSSTINSASKSGSTKWLIIFILLLALGGGGVYYFATSGNEPIATPTPSYGVIPITDEETVAEPTPTSTPVAVNKEDITIEVQNGTGTPGEAAFVQGKLKTLGYSEIKVGNASSTSNTDTIVTFTKSVPVSVQDEIKKELEKSFKTVTVKSTSSQTSDVIIVTGSRLGTASATTSPSGSPKATSTPTASPTN